MTHYVELLKNVLADATAKNNMKRSGDLHRENLLMKMSNPTDHFVFLS